MFDEPTNLSSDLEWMLESTQVNAALVIGALVREYYSPVYHLAYSLLGNKAEANDAVQRTLLAVMANRHRFTAGLSLKIWIYRHAVMVCKGIKRQFWKRRLKAQIPLSQLLVAHNIERETQADRLIWSCVDHLAPSERVVALLRYVYSFNPKEIAQALGTSNRVAELRLADTRYRLNRRLSKHLCRLGACSLEKKHSPTGLAHRQARRLMSRYISGNSSERERARLERHLQLCPFCLEYLDRLKILEDILEQSLSLRYRAALETKFNFEELSAGLLARMNRQQTRQRAAGTVQQTLIGAAILILVVAAGLFANQIALPKVAPQSKVQTVIVTRVVHHPVTPQPEQFGSYLAAPLKPNSDANEIRFRMAESRSYWSSLWLEGRIIFYGPPGYIGPPQVFRNQVWVQQTGSNSSGDEKVILAGQEGSDPQYVSFINQEGTYQIELPRGLSYFTHNPSSVPNSDNTLYGAQESLDKYDFSQVMNGEAISKLFSSTELLFPGSDMHIIHTENILNRRALAVEVLQKSGERDLLWVDGLSGIVLRWQRFIRKDTDLITEEYLVTSLVVNADFPEAPANAPYLWLESFRWDNTWKPKAAGDDAALANDIFALGREPLFQVSPPSDFDPAKTDLAFQWPMTATFTGTTTISGSIFANGLYLGEADIGNPWRMVCERSPDGSKLALYSESGDQVNYSLERQLFWLDLRNLDRSHQPLPEGSTVGNMFAFSPDSRSLAFWGCGGNDQNCGIYLTDLRTQKNRKLETNASAPFYLIWSPDSTLVAAIRPDQRYSQSSKENLLVLRAGTGGVVYNGVASIIDDTLVLPGEKGVYWGIPYPPAKTGLEGCVSPP